MRYLTGQGAGGYRLDLSTEEKIEVSHEMFPWRKPTQWNLTVSLRIRKIMNEE